MLARTAENLFWLARYMERAEYVARLIQVAQRLTGTTASNGDANEWHSAIVAAGCEEGFVARHGEEVTPEAAIDYLVRDPENSSSILSCFETARRNSRSVRTALTADMWDAINTTWLEVREFDVEALLRAENLTRFLEWTKERAGLFNGAYANSMLRNDAFYFTRLGTFIERADNTARILDVKYHVLLPQEAKVGGVIDYYQWASILRAVSALRAYRWVYPGRMHPWQVAELLILRPELPRSLLFCFEQITANLDLIGQGHGRPTEAQRLAGQMYAKLRYARIDDIFQEGLHEFLTEFIDSTIVLGQEVGKQYLA